MATKNNMMKRTNNKSKKAVASNKFYDKKKLLLEIIPVAIMLALFVIAFIVYPQLPDKVPIHWNVQGQIDNYGSKFIGVFLIPIIFLIFEVLSVILPAMDVFKENIKSFYKYYFLMKVLFGVFFLVLYVTTLMPSFGYKINIAYIIIMAVILLFFALGYIMRHVKRNFFIGIRTPWTLSSDKVWEKTHQIGGILFMAISLILLILLLLLDTMMIYFIFIGLIILTVIFLMFYSYNLYKKESHK